MLFGELWQLKSLHLEDDLKNTHLSNYKDDLNFLLNTILVRKEPLLAVYGFQLKSGKLNFALYGCRPDPAEAWKPSVGLEVNTLHERWELCKNQQLRNSVGCRS